jgi:hypothetical protein
LSFSGVVPVFFPCFKKICAILSILLLLSFSNAFAGIPRIYTAASVVLHSAFIGGVMWSLYEAANTAFANMTSGSVAVGTKVTWIDLADPVNPVTKTANVSSVQSLPVLVAQVNSAPDKYPILRDTIAAASVGSPSNARGATDSGPPVLNGSYYMHSSDETPAIVKTLTVVDAGSYSQGPMHDGVILASHGVWSDSGPGFQYALITTSLDSSNNVIWSEMDYIGTAAAVGSVTAPDAAKFAAKVNAGGSAVAAEVGAAIAATGGGTVVNAANPADAFTAGAYTPPTPPTPSQVTAAQAVSPASGADISDAVTSTKENDDKNSNGIIAAIWGAAAQIAGSVSSGFGQLYGTISGAVGTVTGAISGALGSVSGYISSAVGSLTGAIYTTVMQVYGAVMGVQVSVDGVKASTDSAKVSAASSAVAQKTSTDSVKSSVDSAAAAAAAAATSAGTAAADHKASTDSVKTAVDGVAAAVRAIPAGSGGSTSTSGGLSKSDTTQAVSDALNASPTGSGTGNPANGEYDKEVVGPDKKSIGSRITTFIGSSPIGTLVRGVTLTASGTPTLAFRAFSRDCTMDFSKWETLLRGIGTAMLAITNCYSIFLIFRRED